MARVLTATDISPAARARFKASFTRGAPNACWLWKKSRKRGGYGKMFANGGSATAHRVSYIIHTGPIDPPHLFVLHDCDTPACVNPKHLYLGTQLDNMRDCARRKRHGKHKGVNYNVNPAHGEAAGLAKLRERDVARIRHLALTQTFRALAREFHVDKSTIATIVYGTTWAHLPGALSKKRLTDARRQRNMARADRFRAHYRRVINLLRRCRDPETGWAPDWVRPVLLEATQLAPTLRVLR